VPVAREVFEAHMSGPHQLDRLREDVRVSAGDLLQVPTGTRTEDGLRLNVRVGVQYLEAWLRGVGCVPLYNLMEDAATAEICRSQVWQWIHHGATLEDGRRVSGDLLRTVLGEELERIGTEIGSDQVRRATFRTASDLLVGLTTGSTLENFLTIPAYDLL
ncbi:MAG: malate synthase A, partial [Gemmatimonadetes bacterium]|nr:malate synthase A [Gemmatimonadota bacterium]